MIKDRNHRLNLTIKKHHEGQGPRIMDQGGPGPKPQKRGGPGGVPKIAKFCTRGGKFGGGVFGGVPKNRGHKT